MVKGLVVSLSGPDGSGKSTLIEQRMFSPDEGWVDGVIRRGYGLMGRRPDLALLLPLPYETACERSESKNEPSLDPTEIRFTRHRLYGELADEVVGLPRGR